MKRTKAEKLRRYRAILKSMNLTKDRRGMPIDRGIRKAVALLNLMGFDTTASCEGHLDPKHGDLGPWIDIRPERGDYEKKLRRLFKDHWAYEWKRSGKYPVEFFMPYLWRFGKTHKIRIEIGQEVFANVRPDKAKVPLPVRRWVYEGKRAAMRRFTAYLWERYLGAL